MFFVAPFRVAYILTTSKYSWLLLNLLNRYSMLSVELPGNECPNPFWGVSTSTRLGSSLSLLERLCTVWESLPLSSSQSRDLLLASRQRICARASKSRTQYWTSISEQWCSLRIAEQWYRHTITKLAHHLSMLHFMCSKVAFFVSTLILSAQWEKGVVETIL